MLLVQTLREPSASDTLAQRQIHRSPPGKRRLPCLHQRHLSKQTRRRRSRPRDHTAGQEIHRGNRRCLRDEPSRKRSPTKRERTGSSKHNVRLSSPITTQKKRNTIKAEALTHPSPQQGRQRRHRPSKTSPRPHPRRFRAHVPHQRLRRAQLPLDRRQTARQARHMHPGQPGQTTRRRLDRRLQTLPAALALLGLQIRRARPHFQLRHGIGERAHHRERVRAWHCRDGEWTLCNEMPKTNRPY